MKLTDFDLSEDELFVCTLMEVKFFQASKFLPVHSLQQDSAHDQSHVFVTTTTKNTITINTNTQTAIRQLKQKVEKRTRIPTTQQCFAYADKHLRDDRTMHDSIRRRERLIQPLRNTLNECESSCDPRSTHKQKTRNTRLKQTRIIRRTS